jgi:hypothetical protein
MSGSARSDTALLRSHSFGKSGRNSHSQSSALSLGPEEARLASTLGHPNQEPSRHGSPGFWRIRSRPSAQQEYRIRRCAAVYQSYQIILGHAEGGYEVRYPKLWEIAPTQPMHTCRQYQIGVAVGQQRLSLAVERPPNRIRKDARPVGLRHDPPDTQASPPR